MNRQEWINSLNNQTFDTTEFKEIYLSAKNNFGENVFNQFFNIYLQQNIQGFLNYILQKYKIFGLLDKNNQFIKYY